MREEVLPQKGEEEVVSDYIKGFIGGALLAIVIYYVVQGMKTT